jgi:F0F1-type ATP synthase assembly protein I
VGHISNAQFLAAYAVATVVGVTVFLHADRNGSRHPTAWGISVFLFLGIALPVYVIHVVRTRGPKRRW